MLACARFPLYESVRVRKFLFVYVHMCVSVRACMRAFFRFSLHVFV